MKDLTAIKDSKSTKLPHGFVSDLDARIAGVLVGKEKMPEYSDNLVKRTFGAFLNELRSPQFRKNMEKDRKVEDAVLMFYSRATTELKKGKAANDDSHTLMVDRHLALFLRLIRSTLNKNDWIRDRPELNSRLQNYETKLLRHDQDLADASQRAGGLGGTTVEVEVPRSYEAKDMPLVLRTAKIFGVSYDQVQADITANKSVWTEKAALQDLKIYQAHLSLNSKRMLSSDDFDLEEAYEAWKKAETPELSHMIAAILQSNPDLAKSAPGGSLAQFKPASAATSDSGYSDISRKISDNSDGESSHVFDQPVDMSVLNLSDGSPRGSISDDTQFTYIPPDPRAYYRYVLMQAYTYDLNDPEFQSSKTSGDAASSMLSKQTIEVLNDAASRWRIPPFSRMVLFLDVIREKFQHQDISIDTLDAAFIYTKEPPPEGKKGGRQGLVVQASAFDRTKWTVQDFALNQHILSLLNDTLLRELFELLQHCYENKPPSIGPVMYVLENHIYNDPSFTKTAENLDQFSDALRGSLRQRSKDAYNVLLDKNVPTDANKWEFYHVIQLGKAVVTLANKIQKRYKNNPEIMGVNPLSILVAEMLPSFAADARDMVSRIMELAKSRGEEVPIQDGFDLYRELVEIRQVHAQALPGVEFAFYIEGLLQEFVWRWIKMTDDSIIGWVENAVKQDNFTVRTEHAGNTSNDEERHSVSVVDMFRSFNQSIDQIAKLGWDDDLQYAKFMTALSKSVGQGVAKYCELLEQQFAREMNRTTPEQDAVAKQTRQEKYVRMAKNAWNNQEKIEPFQFLPESLVKLNNIEFSTLQLDKLEKEVNVDACAEVIQQHTPPQTQRQRLPTNFVFTIKIIEAEDLKACDPNGYSDPYVVLGDEYQKRLAKTRIIYRNLNPRWDETVDITTQGPLNIIATIWDWDTLGDHDCVGRTSLKLDPSHFGDYMPREYWLDLDTQGRLLLRVSMEGERDDIQFYFGKAFRTLKRTERDMTRKITDKLSPYIHQCLSRGTLKALLNQGISISSVRGYFQKNRPQSVAQGPTATDVENALSPLFTYFQDNFAIMKQTLTDAAMVMVMTRLWKEVLVTIESLLVPPLSDKLSQQRQLTRKELDIVFKWLQLLFDFFHAVDEETGVANGVPLDVLKSPKYHDLQNLNFFYFDPTEELIRVSESMAANTAARHADQAARLNNRLSAPPPLGGFNMVLPSARRSKSVMLARNLGTMKKAKEEKRREAQADPNDDMILRILRMRPEAERYLKDRSRQKERLAAAAAAEMIVRQSLAAGRMGGAVGGMGRR
ncbi:hypothetical protein LTR50_003908 [Elasticomyces elasticus]|nr:hypothetical protein LTR50_003908 [Elasticomyces elasticus]